MRFTEFLTEAKSSKDYGLTKALKERGVGLLNRANEYLLNN